MKRDLALLHHNGGAGKHPIVGRTDIPGVKESIKKYNYDYGFKFVNQGYVVSCSDARGAGERREEKHKGTDIKSLIQN